MMDWHHACSSLFPGRQGHRASRSLGGRCALVALLLAQLALPARLAAAEPGSDLSEIGWSRLLFVATDDDSVPTRYQRHLWDALGRPEMIEIRGGHYTGIAVYLPHLLRQSQAFLGERLGAP